MNARERVLTALDHKEADRVPIAFTVPEKLAERLRERYQVEDNLSLYQAMGIDGFAIDRESYVFPEYVGPNPYNLPWINYINFWGYHDGHPLENINSIEALDDHVWPEADWFSYDNIGEECRKIRELGIPVTGGEGGCGMQQAVHMRRYNNALMDPLTDPDFTHAYMERMGDMFVEWNERWLAAGDFDIFRAGDEIGTMSTTHCNPDVWREFYKPQLKRVFAVAKRHGCKIWFHCCGCCRPLIEDMIEIGVDLWDPVDEYVTGNNHVELKREFGDRLSFIGGLNSKKCGHVPTPDEIRENVRQCIDTLGPGGGYILSGAVSEDWSLETVLAMFDEAVNYGVYSHP
ncbi:MAG: hypothetical protein HQ559_15615 [Lentisphaerae bacterium]|nr:hypothetical protein [Lentisphaerota bacterium]